MLRFRLLCIDPPDGVDAKVTEYVVEATAAYRAEDIARAFNLKTKKVIHGICALGQHVDSDDLLATNITRSLTWTPPEPGFHIVEASSLQCLFDRGEAYRLYPVLKSLREINASCSKGPRAMRASSGSGGVYFLKNSSSPGS